MLRVMKMLGGVFVLGGIAAAHVTATEAFSKVDPVIAHLQAFLAAIAAGSYFANFFDMRTSCLCLGHASPLGFMVTSDPKTHSG
jgi:hypothetical protein